MPTEYGQSVQGRIVNVSAEQSVAVDPNLKKCIEGKNCIAFIGSGPSIKPYCGWVELVNRLCARCGVSEQVTEDTPKDKLPAIAEKARKADIDAYHGELGKIFGHIGMTNPLYDVLMRIPFKCYVTTNFDPLLASEAEKPEHDCRIEMYPSLDPANINGKPRTIFYIHGLINVNSTPRQGSVVLSQSEFSEAYDSESDLSSFLRSLLTHHPICFIGCQLEESPLKTVFDVCSNTQARIRAQHGGPIPERFILLPEQEQAVCVSKQHGSMAPDPREAAERRAKEEQQYQELSIKIVRYAHVDEYHSGLSCMLKPLSNLHLGARARIGLSPEVISYG